MSILNKFKNIKIDVMNILSEDDKSFLEELQEDYENIYNNLIKMTEIAKKLEELKSTLDFNLYDSVCYNIGTYKIVHDSMKSFNDSFNNKVVNYFERTYNIHLENLKYIKDESNEHLNNDKLNYKEIVERIFTLSMNGKNFNEVRIEQLKKDLEDICSYKDILVRKNKLIINDFMYFSKPSYSWETDYHTSNYVSLKHLALALKEFCGCPVDLIYKKELDNYKVDFKEIGGMTEVNYDIINSYKLYKNGKIEISFIDNESPVKFAKKWLNRNI